ncbi:MAG: ribonuclease Z [Acidobacteria bacterium]|nr:ribonuclease Z [Acidobacteriota bacterium]
MKIIPLGTSSGKPTLHRNVSALAVVGEGEWWLFDCGEGTQMQIARAGLSPQKLVGIFISHLHGDHFNGLPGLLSSMALDNRQKELTLVGPTGIREYLDLLSKLKICHVNYPLKLHEFDAYHFKERTEERVYESPRFTVATRPLDHRIFALGFRLEEKMKPGRFDLEKAQALGIPAGPLYGQLQAGKAISLADGRVIEPAEVLGPPRPGKIVSYCLDTRPCDNAVILSRNADWLIHEATFTEDHLEESHHFGHSTAIQAAEIARAADAKRLLITHFSSRYGDTRSLLEEARTVFSATVAAEDLQELEV